MCDDIHISTYIINLPERTDRLDHILEQFRGRDEFEISLIEACRHEVGAIGLWKSIAKITKIAIEKDEDVMILCEDDHKFTPNYNRAILFDTIINAGMQGANLLLGGISGFGQAIPLTSQYAWVDRFQGTQFIIVYRSFFERILEESFNNGDAADIKFSEMTSHKMVFCPYISTQQDFGYSDIPIEGLPTSRYSELFNNSQQKLDAIYRVAARYGMYGVNHKQTYR